MTWEFRKDADPVGLELFRRHYSYRKRRDQLSLFPIRNRNNTYVNAEKVKSRNPGYCFIMAGWRKCGMTKSGLLIFEILPPKDPVLGLAS